MTSTIRVTERERTMEDTTRPETLVIKRVPEIIIKKRRKDDEILNQINRQVKNERVKGFKFIRAEELVKRHRIKTADRNRFEKTKELLRKEKENYETKDVSNVFVILKVADSKNCCQDVFYKLKKLGLLKKYSVRFLEDTPINRETLEYIKPFVAFGQPSLKLLKELLIKRATTLVDGIETVLSNNKIIEDGLGKYGIVTIEELIYELKKCGPYISEILNFLSPFCLYEAPKCLKELPKFLIPHDQRGNIGNEINNLISLLN